MGRPSGSLPKREIDRPSRPRRLRVGLRLASPLLLAMTLALGGWRPGDAPRDGPSQEAVVVEVTEVIGVSDAVQALLPAVVAVSEEVFVRDVPSALLPVTIDLTESVVVSDLPVVLPPAVVEVAEPVTVDDALAVVPSVVLNVSEAIAVADAIAAAPPAVVEVTEEVTVVDASLFIPQAVVEVSESVTVLDEVALVPPAVVTIAEDVTVLDSEEVTPPAIVSVAENVSAADALDMLPGVVVELNEVISVLDLPDLILAADLALSIGSYKCDKPKSVMPVTVLGTPSFDATRVDHETVRFGKLGTEAAETHEDKQTGGRRRHEADVDGDGDLDLLFHFVFGETGLTCGDTEAMLTGRTFAGADIAAHAMLETRERMAALVSGTADITVTADQPVMTGASPATFTVQVGGVFADQVVALRCDDLPRYTSCRFSPSVVKPGADPAVSRLVVFSERRSGSSLPLEWPQGPLAGLAVLLIIAGTALGLRRRHPRRLALPLALLLIGVALHSACGDDGVSLDRSGPDPGEYDFVVAAGSGDAERTANAVLVVE